MLGSAYRCSGGTPLSTFRSKMSFIWPPFLMWPGVQSTTSLTATSCPSIASSSSRWSWAMSAGDEVASSNSSSWAQFRKHLMKNWPLLLPNYNNSITVMKVCPRFSDLMMRHLPPKNPTSDRWASIATILAAEWWSPKSLKPSSKWTRACSATTHTRRFRFTRLGRGRRLAWQFCASMRPWRRKGTWSNYCWGNRTKL